MKPWKIHVYILCNINIIILLIYNINKIYKFPAYYSHIYLHKNPWSNYKFITKETKEKYFLRKIFITSIKESLDINKFSLTFEQKTRQLGIASNPTNSVPIAMDKRNANWIGMPIIRRTFFHFPRRPRFIIFPVRTTLRLIDRIETPSLISRQNDYGRRREEADSSLSEFFFTVFAWSQPQATRSLEKSPIKLNISPIWVVTSDRYRYSHIPLGRLFFFLCLAKVFRDISDARKFPGS